MFSVANKLMIVVTACICVGQMGWWFGQLPDPIPSHFDASGQVDGHMSKTSFYVFIGLAHVVLLIGFPLLGRVLKRLPDSMINVPHKEYWLAPERRDETMDVSLGFLSTIGWITSWLFIGVFQLTAAVAINQLDSISPEFYWMLGIYLAAVALLVSILLFKFRLPAMESDVQMQ